jgi:ACT domain-containing protein
MRAVITVIGKDTVGILAKVSGICADSGANIMEVTQSVLQKDEPANNPLFAMIMLADITALNVDFTELQDKMTKLGTSLGLSIHTMHEDIFNSMHKV